MREMPTLLRAYNIHIMVAKISFSSDRSEINAILPKNYYNNVEGFLCKVTKTIYNHRKTKKANETQGDNSNQDGYENFHLLNQYLQQMRDDSQEVRCIICSWKNGNVVKL